jgi:excisionase family DNA binding protein
MTTSVQEAETVPVLAYSLQEAARATGVSRSKLYEEIQAGHLGIMKVGDRTLVEPAELRRWMRTKRQPRRAR